MDNKNYNPFPEDLNESRFSNQKEENEIKENVSQKEETTNEVKKPQMWTERKTYTPPPKKDETSWKYVLYTILLVIVLVVVIYLILTGKIFKKEENVEQEYDSKVVPKFILLKENEYDKSRENAFAAIIIRKEDTSWDVKISYDKPTNYELVNDYSGVTYQYFDNYNPICEIALYKVDNKVAASAYAYSYAKNKGALNNLGRANINNIDWYTTILDDEKEYIHFGTIDNDLYGLEYRLYNKQNEKECNDGYSYFIKSVIKK